MKLSRILFLFSLLVLLFIVASQTTSAQTLPAKVKSYLDKNYSGWKMSGNDRNCAETKRFVATGDFNGDKKTDYAVKFVKGRTGYILAFVSQRTDYKAHVLESAPASEMKFTVLDVERKGKKYPIGGDIPDLIYGKLPNDAPYTIPCESDAVAFYVYKNGRFQ